LTKRCLKNQKLLYLGFLLEILIALEWLKSQQIESLGDQSNARLYKITSYVNWQLSLGFG
jgi:hypothetical protein